MSDQTTPKPTRRATAAIVGVLIAVLVVVTVVGLITGAALPPASSPSRSAVPAATAPSTSAPAVVASATPTPTATATRTSKPVPTAAPTPQPTRTAPIAQSTPAAIRKELSVRVVKMEAVTGAADGPGEIAGPSVRFTIRVENTTGRTVDLSHTVVNAYFGEDESPAVPLRLPGGKDLPASVKDGGAADGVYLFNIPADERADVKVTVDTAVNNPVIAFEGAAPKA